MKTSFLRAMFFIVFIHAAATRAVGRAHRLGNETDHAALLAIKTQLVDHHSDVFSSWNHSLHHCYWDGVTCGPKHDRVVVLDLSSRGLVGTISPLIGNLSFLKDIQLFNNSLVGQIPPEIGRLFRLQVLRLSNNTLEGEIPANLSACINLEELSIERNKLEGKLPLELRALSKLKFVGLHFNSFTGPLFEAITNITSIEVISAANNSFTGYIPMSIGKMRNLNTVMVGGNQLSGTIPTSILNCSVLETLFVSYNKLYGELPSDIGLRLPHLTTLHLHSNQFSGSFPYSILNLTSINSIYLGSNNFVGRIPHDFGHRLPNLLYLSLDFNHFEGDINFVGSLVNCSKLEILELSGNKFTGILPNSVANLSTSLWAFVLEGCGIRGEIPVHITNLVNLRGLILNENELIGSMPQDLGKFQNIQLIDFDSNRLTSTIPDSFRNLSRLSELYLSNNQLEGGIPRSLGGCQSLLYLDLSFNRLHGTLEFFKGSTKFIQVDLSDNLLEGFIPQEISKQINLIAFFVRQNKLSGIVPYGLGDCFSLQILDIHGNFFHGYIPSSFSSLGSLQIVDFSDNNLSGVIPDYFSKFHLQLLNLSFNNFEGQVPTTGVFANISAIALDGNIKLCGGIPMLHLPRCMQQKEITKRRHSSSTLKLIVPIFCALGLFVIVTWLCLSCYKKKRVPTSSGVGECKQGVIGEAFLKVSYDMLVKATNGFASENLIGVGSFGSVFKGNLDEMTIAVKVLNLQTQGASKSFMIECKALRNVRHRNLVGIITACSSIDFHGNDFRALVYEFMPNGSLDRWLHEGGAEKLTLAQRVDVAINVAHALYYLHHDCEIPIVHCDLKPSNILLDNDMVARVGDFGVAKFLTQTQHPNQSSSIGCRGTAGYAAPEYGLGCVPSPDSDLYSYGILLLELIIGKRPTDNIFQEDYNLHTYAEAVFPDNVLQIVDPTLVNNEITEEVEDIRTIQAISQRRVECMVSLISVGIACSKHLPQDRMKIGDAISKLQIARDNLCNVRLRRNFPKGA